MRRKRNFKRSVPKRGSRKRRRRTTRIAKYGSSRGGIRL